VNPPRAAAACAALAAVFALALVPVEADAEVTYLMLDPVPRLVVGELATFTGALLASSGQGVPGALVEIKDDDPGFDDLIATTRTGGDGRFSVRVVVKDWDRWGDASDIYAVFEGRGAFAKSRSATQEAPVLPAGSSASGQQHSVYAQASYSTQLQLHIDKSKVYAGETVTFSGTLTTNGRPLSGATVYIKEDDSLLRDEVLAKAKTDQDGRYSAKWRAAAGTIETEFDVYAVFEKSGRYERDRTSNHSLHVIKQSGSITLDPITKSVRIGEPVTFSGSLSLPGIDTTNAIVYIKDEDALNPDDLLATAYVDGSGRYAVTWIAKKVDYDEIADIYAVFEGDSTHYRLTTCDSDPTRFFGGLCQDTRQLRTWPARPITPPGPANSEYVALNYVVPFQGRPTVAISPSHDSYDITRQHIIPTREGIEKLSSELAERHGGDWNVNFEILAPGKWRADTRADIVLNIVTSDDDDYCNDVFGWAPVSPKALPIQINVCSTHDNHLRASSDVMRTATHEFAHAVGMGHTFNKKNDMMCSVENSRETCPGTYANKAQRPSWLVLDAMAALYRSDGYSVPNNMHGKYFAYRTGVTTAQEETSSWTPPQQTIHVEKADMTLEISPSKKFPAYPSYVKSLDYLEAEIEYLNDNFTFPFVRSVHVNDCGTASYRYDPVSRVLDMCYEDIVEYVRTANDLDYDNTTINEYVVNNMEFALYRGMGNSLVGVYGHLHGHYTENEEEISDSFAAYLILTTYEDPDMGQNVLYDASTHLYAYSESSRGSPALREHSLERFNLLTCYAYGQDPASREHLSTDGWLPDNMRDSCESMYSDMVSTWNAVLDYIDAYLS